MCLILSKKSKYQAFYLSKCLKLTLRDEILALLESEAYSIALIRRIYPTELDSMSA